MSLNDSIHRAQMDMLAAQQKALEKNLGHANVIHNRLMLEIAEFEEGLSKDEELGGHLAAFGREVLISIENVRPRDPYLIVFEGTIISSGSRVRLVQHVSQLNVLFTAVPRRPENSTPRRIGFEFSREGRPGDSAGEP